MSTKSSLGSKAASGSPLFLDHAATSFPKPAEVGQAMLAALQTTGNAGRSGHALALEAARTLHRMRTSAARLFGMADAKRVILTPSCTSAINLVIRGLAPDVHVVTTSMEHNAVARTLVALRDQGELRFTVVQADSQGYVAPHQLAAACTPDTSLVVVNHASNVCGAIQDVRRIRQALPGHVRLLVDASQTAGALPLLVDELGLDYVAVSGHKGLLGPTGTGLLLLGPTASPPPPLVTGGTGSGSESDKMPLQLPDRLEAGTPNIPGAAGLRAGIDWLLAMGTELLATREQQFIEQVLAGIRTMEHIRLIGPGDYLARTGTFSFLVQGCDPGLVAFRLERESGILVRSGLHCAPWAHQTLGTFPHGTVRVSWGVMAEPNAAERLLDALRELGRGAP